MFAFALPRSVLNWAQSYQSWWCTAEVSPSVALKMHLKNLQTKCLPSLKVMPSSSSKTQVQLCTYIYFLLIQKRRSKIFVDTAFLQLIPPQNVISLQCIMACYFLLFICREAFCETQQQAAEPDLPLWPAPRIIQLWSSGNVERWLPDGLVLSDEKLCCCFDGSTFREFILKTLCGP